MDGAGSLRPVAVRLGMTSRPLVSVLVTCYDLGRYLFDALDSALTQTAGGVEVLVTDDGSTDIETIRALDAIADARVRVFRWPHQGLAGARNGLVAEARGRFLCALDADDRLHPRFLEKTLAEFARRPALTVVSSWLTMFGAESRVWRQSHADLPTLLAECTLHTAALVRREAVIAAGGYCPDLPHPGYEDWDLWISIVERGGVAAILPESLFYYRRRPGSMSARYDAPGVHRELYAALISRHESSYARHWEDVFLRLQAESAALRRANRTAELAEAEQASTITRLDAELSRLQARLEQARC
jgi:glycosyltransferase involved in cell wall biosynthesis